MTGAARRTRGVVAAALAAASLASCSDPGDLSVLNEGPEAITVLTGDETLEVPPEGGASLLGYGCSPGDVTVQFDSGATVALPGPVCPDTQIVARDGTVVLRPSGTQP